MLSRINKIEKGMKVKLIPEHNQIQKFDETMELIILKQKKKANKFFNRKKSINFENKYKKRMVNSTRGIQVPAENIRFFENHLNVVISKKEANQIKLDSCTQYVNKT